MRAWGRPQILKQWEHWQHMSKSFFSQTLQVNTACNNSRNNYSKKMAATWPGQCASRHFYLSYSYSSFSSFTETFKTCCPQTKVSVKTKSLEGSFSIRKRRAYEPKSKVKEGNNKNKTRNKIAENSTALMSKADKNMIQRRN